MFLKNVAGQKVGAQLTTISDGSPFTGSVTVAVTVDAGTQATGSVSSGACTHEGGGYHTYAPAQAETNGELIAFTFSGTGAYSVTVQVYTLPATGVLAPATLGRTLVVDASGLADANTVKLGPSGSGTAQTARDIGASVLLSSGTGTGQVSLTSGKLDWNAAWDAEVQSEVQDAIEVNHLDHLIAVADPTGVVANNSFLAKLVSKSATAAWTSYNNTTDSHEAIRDVIGTPADLGTGATLGKNFEDFATAFPENFAFMQITLGGIVSANAVEISGDSTAADNLEKGYDGTGYRQPAHTWACDKSGTWTPFAAGSDTDAARATAVLAAMNSTNASVVEVGPITADFSGKDSLGKNGVNFNRALGSHFTRNDGYLWRDFNDAEVTTAMAFSVLGEGRDTGTAACGALFAFFDAGSRVNVEGVEAINFVSTLGGYYAIITGGGHHNYNFRGMARSDSDDVLYGEGGWTNYVSGFAQGGSPCFEFNNGYAATSGQNAGGNIKVHGPVSTAHADSVPVTTLGASNRGGAMEFGHIQASTGSKTAFLGGSGSWLIRCPSIAGRVEIDGGTHVIDDSVVNSTGFAVPSVVISGSGATFRNTPIITDSGQTDSFSAASAQSVNISGGVPYNKALSNVTLVQVDSVAAVTGNVGGNVVGSVASVVGNVGGNVTGSVGSLTSTAQGNVRTAVGLASANLDTQLDALPTAAENTTAVWAAGTRVLTAGTNIVLAKGTGVTGFTDLDAAGVRTAVGLGSANLDTQLGDIPTVSEFNARTIVSASYSTLVAGDAMTLTAAYDAAKTAATQASVDAIDTVADAVKAKTDQLTFTTPNKVDSTADVELSEENIDDIAEGVAESIGVDPANVDADHTWTFDSPAQTTSPKTIQDVIGFKGLVAIDFTQPMPARSAIQSVTSATFTNSAGTEPTVTSFQKNTNAKGVNVLIDCTSATAGTYTLNVKVVTTDNQTFVRSGRITLR